MDGTQGSLWCAANDKQTAKRRFVSMQIVPQGVDALRLQVERRERLPLPSSHLTISFHTRLPPLPRTRLGESLTLHVE